MARQDLTNAFIRNYVPEKREDIVDTREPGLTLRVTPSGRKTFSVRVRSSDGVDQRITLGTYPDISLKEARSLASQKRAEVRASIGNLNRIRKAEFENRSAAPTLRELVAEYKTLRSENQAIWKPAKRSRKAEAERRIHAVFSGLLDTRVNDITPDDLAEAMLEYVPLSGKKSANGQSQKARLYLMSVFDWAAGRGRFRYVGKKRRPTLDIAELRDTVDPASDDPEIRGARTRVLLRDEMVRILPWLTFPARPELGMRMDPSIDVRPIAMRFMLLTASRLNEVVVMRWNDVNFEKGEWFKPVVKTTRGEARSQLLPISDAAIELLRLLPGFERRKHEPKALVFPSSVDTELDNWNRVKKAIQRESGTSDWHRHDLRRTSSSLMRLLGVELSTIDQILAHVVDHNREGTSAALDPYLQDMQIEELVDPQKVALDRLAETYDAIERSKA